MSVQNVNTIACMKQTIRSLFPSSVTNEKPISRDDPVSCSKKYNIEVDFMRHQYQKTFVLSTGKDNCGCRQLRVCVRVCV